MVMYVMTRPKEASSPEYRERVCSNTTGTLHHYPLPGTAADGDTHGGGTAELGVVAAVASSSSTSQHPHLQPTVSTTTSASTPPMMVSPQPSTMLVLSEEEHEEINIIASSMAYKYPTTTPIVRNAVHFQQFGSRPQFLEHEAHHEHQLRQQHLKDQAVKELLYVPPVDDGFAATATSQLLKQSQTYSQNQQSQNSESPKSARGVYTSALRTELSALMKEESSHEAMCGILIESSTKHNMNTSAKMNDGKGRGVLPPNMRRSLSACDILGISGVGGGLGSTSMTLGDEDRRSLAMSASCRRGSFSREGGVVKGGGGMDPLHVGSLTTRGGTSSISSRPISATSSPSPITRGLATHTGVGAASTAGGGIGFRRRRESMTSFTTMGDMEQPLPSSPHLLPHPSLTRAHSNRSLSFSRGASMVANASKAVSGMRAPISTSSSPSSPLDGGRGVIIGSDVHHHHHHPDCAAIATPILGRSSGGGDVRSVSPMLQASSVFGQYAFDIQPDTASSNHTTDFTDKMKGEILSRTRSSRSKHKQQQQRHNPLNCSNSGSPAATSLSATTTTAASPPNQSSVTARSPPSATTPHHLPTTNTTTTAAATITDVGSISVGNNNNMSRVGGGSVVHIQGGDDDNEGLPTHRPRNQSHTLIPDTDRHPDSSTDECPSSAFGNTTTDLPLSALTTPLTAPLTAEATAITTPIAPQLSDVVDTTIGVVPGSGELLKGYTDTQRITSTAEYYTPILCAWSGELERYTRGEVSWLEKKERSNILSNEMAAALAQHRDRHRQSRDGAVRRAQEVLRDVGAQIAQESAALQDTHARECADMQSSLAQLFEEMSVDIATAEIDYPPHTNNSYINNTGDPISASLSVEIHADANANSPGGVSTVVARDVAGNNTTNNNTTTTTTTASSGPPPAPPSLPISPKPLSFAERIKQGEGTDRGRAQREIVPAHLIPPPASDEVDGGAHQHRPSVGQITRVPTPPPKPFKYFPTQYLADNNSNSTTGNN